MMTAMYIIMNDSRIDNVSNLKDFLKGARKFDLSLREVSLEERYAFIDETVDRLDYRNLSRTDKGVVFNYLKKITGYKKAQLYRLVDRAVLGKLTRREYRRSKIYRYFDSVDIKLLERTDEYHLRFSEKATVEILRREYEVFGHGEYEKLSKISHSHISNLRHSPIYRNFWINHTKARQVPIGATQKPENFSRPGSIRVDSVSQREVYHINTVDEITQWEIIFCVPQICEACVLPALLDIFDQYPFKLFNFHSDRGGETINYQVANFLQRLLIKQTKSRSYHPNDNALVETKNGSIIRKNMGWQHINQDMADEINLYYRNWFNPYLNFHRPSGFPSIQVDEKGRKRKIYDLYQTPYDSLKSIPAAQNFLKPELNFQILDKIAYEYSDNEFAKLMRQEETKLFAKIRQSDHQDGFVSNP